MKRIIAFWVLISFGISVFAQLQTIDIEYPHCYDEYDSPFCYEKRGDVLCVKARIDLNKDTKIVRVTFNDALVETSFINGVYHFWLPLIGNQGVLRIFTANSAQPIIEQIYSPLIPQDWGYFQNGEIHIISSSHQDIGWVNTPDSCRHTRIHNIINPAIEMMKSDKGYAFGMEQTLNLMEFLEEFPERKNEVMQLYKEGRFIWGATYNQPYEGLESGEQLIRQTYYGRKWIKDNLPGCDDVTAYNVDVPGRTLQMPQILKKSGIKNLFVSRMREGLYNWSSPDGSEIFTYTPGNYSWVVDVWRYFNDGAVRAFHRLHERSVLWSDYFREHNIPPHYAIVVSADASGPGNYTKVVDEWNKIVDMADIPLPRIRHSTTTSYFETVNVPETRLEKVSGERPNLWLYIHGPAHYQAIAAKRKAGVLLPAAEMFTTFNCLLNNNWETYPKAVFDRAWMSSIYPDHGWGGKNGHITDSIFRVSLEQARDMGEQLLDNAMVSLAEKVKSEKNAIVVFNDLSWARTNVVSMEVSKDIAANIRTVNTMGKEVPCQLTCRDEKFFLTFIAEDVPSLGYKTYYWSHSKSSKKVSADWVQMSNFYENKFYRVTLGHGGIKTLHDKELNQNILNTTKFSGGDILHLGYTGNGAGEFTRIHPVTPGDIQRAGSDKRIWQLVETGPVFSIFESSYNMRHTTVIHQIKLYHSIKKIDFDITLKDFDGTHNRQFRIALPLNMRQNTIHYEVPMGIVEVGCDEMKTIPGGWAWEGTYRQRPEEINPREIQNFISANSEQFGVTMSSCVAVADWKDPSREAVGYPILQGVLLSSHKSCHELGNWYEQKGTHHYTFSILSHKPGWENGYHFGVEANHPLRAVLKATKSNGTLPLQKSFVSISDPFVNVGAVKKSDNGQDIIIRLTEMAGKDSKVNISFPVATKKIIKTSIIEEEQEVLPIQGQQVQLPIGHHAIETYKFAW